MNVNALRLSVVSAWPRKCGLGLVVTKLEATISHSIAMSVLVLNLRWIHFGFLRLLLDYLVSYCLYQKIALIQETFIKPPVLFYHRRLITDSFL